MLLKPANPYILDVKSDIVNQRLYFLTTGKMPIFLQANLDNHTTDINHTADISRRENGAHVRIRIRPAWQARGINRDESAMETLSWCRLQIIIIMMIMRMIMIMVINYNKDRGFAFFVHTIPDPQLPSNLFECTPLAMTYEIA